MNEASVTLWRGSDGGWYGSEAACPGGGVEYVAVPAAGYAATTRRRTMVSDRDMAKAIREAAPGGTWADVMAAWDCVRGRLDSRDDSETARAFREVLDRYHAETPAPCDVEAAEKLFGEIMGLIQVQLRDVGGVKGVKKNYEKIVKKIAYALAAARKAADEKTEIAYLEGNREVDRLTAHAKELKGAALRVINFDEDDAVYIGDFDDAGFRHDYQKALDALSALVGREEEAGNAEGE